MRSAPILLCALLLFARTAHATAMTSCQARLLLPDCRQPTNPEQWPTEVPPSFVVSCMTSGAAGGRNPWQRCGERTPPDGMTLFRSNGDAGFEYTAGTVSFVEGRTCFGEPVLRLDRPLAAGTYVIVLSPHGPGTGGIPLTVVEQQNSFRATASTEPWGACPPTQPHQHTEGPRAQRGCACNATIPTRSEGVVPFFLCVLFWLSRTHSLKRQRTA